MVALKTNSLVTKAAMQPLLVAEQEIRANGSLSRELSIFDMQGSSLENFILSYLWLDSENTVWTALSLGHLLETINSNCLTFKLPEAALPGSWD